MKGGWQCRQVIAVTTRLTFSSTLY